jgi:heme exporter protein B
MSGARVAFAVLSKDLLLDLRSRDRLGHMMLFSAVVSALISICLPPVTPDTRGGITVLVWIVFLLSSLLGLSRSFQAEIEGGALLMLAQVPCDRGWIFLGKTGATWLTLSGLQLWTALLFGLFLNVPWLAGYPTRSEPAGGGVNVLALGGLVLLAAGGVSALGTLLSAIAIRARNREFLLPLLVLPLMLPILVIASNATLEALESRPIPGVWWGVLGLYAWIFLLVGYFTFESVMDD